VSATVTIGEGVRSVTVSTGSETANSCYLTNAAFVTAAEATNFDQEPPAATAATLDPPNGFCITPSVTVTNGGTAGQIDVQGSNATPAGGTGAWTLVQSSAPGTDQYDLNTTAYVLNGTTADGAPSQYSTTAAPACDNAFDVGASPSANAVQGCAATANDSSTEFIGIVGPSSAGTDTATSETGTVTWTAVS
jgi:hypothetical protein